MGIIQHFKFYTHRGTTRKAKKFFAADFKPRSFQKCWEQQARKKFSRIIWSQIPATNTTITVSWGKKVMCVHILSTQMTGPV